MSSTASNQKGKIMSTVTTGPILGSVQNVNQGNNPKKPKGRPKGMKIAHMVSATEFCPKFKTLVEEGMGWNEIAQEFGLSVQTCIQKRLTYNKQSAEYAVQNGLATSVEDAVQRGIYANLPLPKGGKKGAHRIDWSAIMGTHQSA